MGAKYSTQSAVNFNAAPPADDGSTTEANKVKWATILSKLANPVKTLADAINSALVNAFDYGPNSQSSDYSVLALDNDKTIQITAAANVALLAAATATAGFTVGISNQHTAAITITRSGTNTINGVQVDYTLPPGCSVTLRVNAAATGYLIIAQSSGNKAAFLVNKNATDQTGVGTGAFTKLTWVTEEFDVNGYFGSSGFVPPPGKYVLCWNVASSTNIPTNKTFLSTLYKNGVRYKDGISGVSGGNTFTGNSSGGSVVVDGGGSDNFELYVFQDTGGDITISGAVFATHFSGGRVG